MRVATFKVLNNTGLTDEQILLELLQIETVMNSNSILRFHLLSREEERENVREVLEEIIDLNLKPQGDDI